MASITSLTGSSSSSSLYGTRNVISGLASGLDTETLIKNAVSGYNSKILKLQQQQTKLEWKQTSYRSIINKMSAFSEKYASYTSSTNLLSSAFFRNATTVASQGANKDKVSATGKSSSDLQILRVKELATSATYSVSGAALGASSAGGKTGISGDWIDLGSDVITSKVSGTMSFKDGNQTFKISFREDEVYETAADLAAAMEEKLNTALKDAGASENRINVTYADEKFTFTGNNSLTVSASGDIASALNIQSDSESVSSATLDGALSETKTVAERLKDQDISFTLNGTTKTIRLDSLADGATGADVLRALQSELDTAFGEGKIKVKQTSGGESQWTGQGFMASFTVAEGSSLSIKNGSLLGLDSDSESSSVNTGKTLADLLGTDENGKLNGVDANADGTYTFKIGNFSKNYTADTSLSTIMNDINNSSAGGVRVSYSSLANQFSFTARETGSTGSVELGDGLASTLFGGGSSTAGTDAVFSVSVNGKEMDLTRSSNIVDLDGMKVTLKGTFGYDEAGNEVSTEAVTFSSSADADKIVSVIKSMVEDYNAMANEIKDAYSTMPLQNSNGGSYEPLTDEDMEGMSESAIKNYEEKAKTGLLFGDRDLSNLYDQLRGAISLSGDLGSAMRSIGITTTYSDGKTTLSLDESKLRQALETDPDKVADVFSDSSNGMMTKLRQPLEQYGKTYGTKGILVEKAGSELSPMSLYDNDIQNQMDDINDEIVKWQSKLSDRVDFYTAQFTRLEQLINEMNSQSSALSGLMGG